MKKLIVFALIIVMAVPACALAEEHETIIGPWYMYANFEKYPEINTTSEEVDSELLILYFLPSRTIMALSLDINNGKGTPQYTVAGRWANNNGIYSLSFIGSGTGEAYIKDGELFAQLFGQQTSYVLLRKITDFNPYEDVRLN